MFDPIRNRFRFRCPVTERPVDAPLSCFRLVERLPGPGHPAVHQVVFACPTCGDDHASLVSEDELDCGAVRPGPEHVFVNLQTGRSEPLADEFADTAQRELRRGNWPWTFYCAPEHQVRPGYPSRLRMLSPSPDRSLVGVAVHCSTCAAVSINLVSYRHLDQPFFHDPVVRYVDGSFDGPLASLERFRDELWSSRFDEERNDFGA